MTLSKHCVPVKIFSSQVETSSVKWTSAQAGRMFTTSTEGEGEPGEGRVTTILFIIDPRCCYFKPEYMLYPVLQSQISPLNLN